MPPTFDGHPTPGDLAACASDDASPEVAAHVRQCRQCSADVRRQRQTEAALRKVLFRFDCPDPHRLGEYQFDLLGPDERVTIARHLTDCDDCRAELDELRAFLAVEPPMPESLAARVRRVVSTWWSPQQPASPQLASAGLRGGAETTSRLFQVENVTLSIGPGPAPGSLLGLVMAEDAAEPGLAGTPVRLVPAAGAPITTQVDEYGNFEFAEVPAGTYTLEVPLAEVTVVVQELQVH